MVGECVQTRPEVAFVLDRPIPATRQGPSVRFVPSCVKVIHDTQVSEGTAAHGKERNNKERRDGPGERFDLSKPPYDLSAAKPLAIRRRPP